MIKQFIRASAGTGKTHTLLDTIFEYKYDAQTQKNKPTTDYQTACDRINESVFLTFSNSAAEEIRSRIYQGLMQCDGRPETSLFGALAQQNVRIRVYTIHSFALEMLRLFRYKLCLPAELNFTEEDESLWEYCVKEFFAKNWNQKSLQNLLNITPADKAAWALLEVFFFLSQRGNIQDFIEKKGDTLYFLSAMGKSFCFDLPNNSEQVQTLLKDNLAIDVTADYNEAILQARNRLTEIKDRELYKKGKQERERAIAEKKSDLAKLEEKEKNEKRLTARDQTKKDNLIKKIAELEQELQQFLDDIAFLQKVCPVLDMCSYFMEQIILSIGSRLYMPRMLANGIFDFDAVVFLFIKELLRGDVNAFLAELKAENQSFSRIYIDEAQDNDIIQNYLIILFGQGQCPVDVYVVGDLKQSIYTWRNAYPREFEQMLAECSQSTDSGQLLKNLHTSYRLQEQNTCDAINNICEAIATKYPKEWWYDNNQDRLELRQDSQKTHNGKIKMWCSGGKIMSLTTGSEEEENKLDILDEFFASGKTAVVVRSRKQLSKVPDLKEKLQELGANNKLETPIAEGESDQAKTETLQPELELVTLLFMALTEDKVEQVPFALFWAESGKVLTERLQLCSGGQMPADFKEIFEKIYDDISHGVPGNRVERVLHVFDKYNLWNYLSHTALGDDEKNPQQLRRIFYHILMRAYLREDKFNRHANNAFYADPVWAIIQKGNRPHSCYSLPKWAAVEEQGKDRPAPDVITIHGSKGLAYDNMIIVAKFKDDFFGDTENFGIYDYYEPYSQLFSADFKKILGSDPEIAVSYFPYLKTIPAYLLKNKEADTANEFWKKLDQNYQNIERLIRSEQLNLLYVALTRTAKNLLLLDVGTQDKDNSIGALFAAAGVEVCNVDGESQEQDVPAPVRYTYQETPFEPMDIGGQMQTRSVRSEIAGKIYRKYGRHLTCLERFSHAKKGSMVHNVMQGIIGQAKDPQDFIGRANSLGPKPDSLYGQAVQIVVSNEQAINDIQNLLGNYTFYHEVPVWQFNQETGALTKGCIDTLAVNEKKAVIVEYKVNFGNEQAQQTQAQEQMRRYENILRALEKDYSIGKQAVELSEKR